MPHLRIDLRNDPDIPLGRELFEHLVGAHMVSGDEEELLQLVRHSIDELQSMPIGRRLRVLMHATYRGQALTVALLDLATRQHIVLADAGLTPPRGLADREPERFRDERLDLWTRLRDWGHLRL